MLIDRLQEVGGLSNNVLNMLLLYYHSRFVVGLFSQTLSQNKDLPHLSWEYPGLNEAFAKHSYYSLMCFGVFFDGSQNRLSCVKYGVVGPLGRVFIHTLFEEIYG